MVSGAITTKAMREAALYLTGFTRHEVYGVSLDLDPQAVIDRLRSRAARVAAMMSEAVRENLRHHDVAFITGAARLGPDRTVMVDPGNGGTSCVLRADAILVATGSCPFHPPDVPFADPDVLDSETALALDRPLESLVVVGGGAVACEYASIFLALGAEVTLVDRGTRLLPFLDADVSGLLTESFRSYGMRILGGAGVTKVTRTANGLCVETSGGESIRPAKVIFAAGRVGNTADLGLGEVGVATDERGRILVDDEYQTAAPVCTPPGTSSDRPRWLRSPWSRAGWPPVTPWASLSSEPSIR